VTAHQPTTDQPTTDQPTADQPTARDVAEWWATSISRIEPGVVELRGRPVQELIGSVSLVEMVWLLVRGELPTGEQAALLEAALVAGVDHGPQAPSIAAARMAATCGVGLNNAIATGVNLLGDVHGGAGQQCVELLTEIRDRVADGADPDAATGEVVAAWRARSRYLPGFGHRFHPVDPRRGPLLALVERAVAEGVVAGDHLRAGLAVEKLLNEGRDRPVPMNIDGATAIVYAELGFPAPLARGLFVLSRSVGILAHAWEESQQGRRNKGPMPPTILPAYPADRP
jgi:citrate synthase